MNRNLIQRNPLKGWHRTKIDVVCLGTMGHKPLVRRIYKKPTNLIRSY